MLNRALLVAAALCFFVALIIALGAVVFDSTTIEWIAGGLLAWVLAAVIP